MSAQRKAGDARWSARSTLEAVDAQGQKVTVEDPRAAKLVVRWRCDGRNRKKGFSGPDAAADAAADAAELHGLLLVAGSHGCPADANGRPLEGIREAACLTGTR